MKQEFFKGTNVSDWRWRRRSSRRLKRRAEGWRARDRETTFAPRTLRQSTPYRAAQHHAGVAVNIRRSMWFGCVSRSLRSAAVRGYIERHGWRSLMCPSTYTL